MPLSFENLIIWQKAHKFMLEIYRISTCFPPRETYSLIDQIRRAALSVPANIAEAHGRKHYLDKAKFLLNARGSAEEVRSHLMAARDLKYMSVKEFDQLNEGYIYLIKQINSFISVLRQKSK
ncbi:MAG: ribosomal protein [Candidatus Berkelbacteria bacterium]|nr:ribosomal protein [Candidatus Berkelbacteria bacterium]